MLKNQKELMKNSDKKNKYTKGLQKIQNIEKI